MIRLLILAGAALMAIATLLWITSHRQPEYRMADWYEGDEGVQPWDAPQAPRYPLDRAAEAGPADQPAPSYGPARVDTYTLTLGKGMVPLVVLPGQRSSDAWFDAESWQIGEREVDVSLERGDFRVFDDSSAFLTHMRGLIEAE